MAETRMVILGGPSASNYPPTVEGSMAWATHHKMWQKQQDDALAVAWVALESWRMSCADGPMCEACPAVQHVQGLIESAMLPEDRVALSEARKVVALFHEGD